MGRPRVYDASELARDMRERFAARPVEFEERVARGWPGTMQNVGTSLSVAYGSDKWKAKRNGGREVELYKHLAESPNWAFVTPGLLHDFQRPKRRWPVTGPMVSFANMPMPRHFAILGFCEAVQVQLYAPISVAVKGKRAPRVYRDDGIVQVDFPHGMLGASEILWNEVEPGRSEIARWHRDNPQPGDDEVPPDFNEPFIFVYTRRVGVMMIIVGERLDVQKEGIVG